MNAEQQENLRLAILRVMDSNRTRFGLTVPAITTMLVQYGCTPTRDQVLDEMDYFEKPSRQFVEEVLKSVSKENRAWRLSDAGRAHLDKLGF